MSLVNNAGGAKGFEHGSGMANALVTFEFAQTHFVPSELVAPELVTSVMVTSMIVSANET